MGPAELALVLLALVVGLLALLVAGLLILQRRVLRLIEDLTEIVREVARGRG